jgi:FtsZ-binding cell division protein ZapB
MKKTKDNEQLALAGTEEAEILARLSERVEKAVSTIQELRRERDQLRRRVEELESVQDEQERFRRERDEIRDRIENILASLEALEGE